MYGNLKLISFTFLNNNLKLIIMKKIGYITISLLLMTSYASAQNILSGGLKSNFLNESYTNTEINYPVNNAKKSGRYSGYDIGGKLLYIGILLVNKTNIDHAGIDYDESSIVIRYYAGVKIGKMIISANYEYDDGISDIELPSIARNNRIFGELLYPVITAAEGIFTLYASAGAGVNLFEEGYKYNYNTNENVISDSETTLYMPFGAYVDLVNPEAGGWYAFRVGYHLGLNATKFKSSSFSAEGFSFGLLIRI